MRSSSGDADDDDGDVVLAAAPVGEGHQGVSAGLQVVSRQAHVASMYAAFLGVAITLGAPPIW